MKDVCNLKQGHFGLKVNGKDVLYLYIRKNGCSTWKHFFAGYSEHKKNSKKYENLLGFMGEYHKIRRYSDLRKFEDRILVVREPVDRLFSGFINQFLMRFERTYSLHDSVASKIDKPIEKITFREFLYDYILASNDDDVDAHFWSQSSHLAPIEYNHIWKIEDLAIKTKELFGDAISKRYFTRKRNTTSRINRYHEDCSSIPCGELYEKYVKTNTLPSFDSLIDSEFSELISSRYADDVKLYTSAE